MDCGSFGKEKHSNFSEGGNADIVELHLDKGVDVSAGDGVGNAAVMSHAGAGYRDEPFRRNRKDTASDKRRNQMTKSEKGRAKVNKWAPPLFLARIVGRAA
jgi:hypothetical protein